MKTLILILLMITSTSLVAKSHPKELLGKQAKSIKVKSEKETTKEIIAIFKSKLPKKYKSRSKEFGTLIVSEAKKYKMDPYFILAVLSGESSFNPEVIGPVKEIGFMQLRPATGEWMCYKLRIKWKGEQTLRDPVLNIKLGVVYLSWLRERFNKDSRLYIAAYNMGEQNVIKALSKNIKPKDYPQHVMKRYLSFYK